MTPNRFRARFPSRTRAAAVVPPLRLVALVAGLAVVLLACGDGDADDGLAAGDATTTTTVSGPGSTTTEATPDAVVQAIVQVDETSFRNLNDLTRVRGFVVDNLLGDLDATVAVAENPDGGVYPVGSLVQLVPTEAMVKREAGFSPATNDWEFFELAVSGEGTAIVVRGGDEVINSFGLSCANCHLQAEPQWDLICEQDHGCDPLPFPSEVFLGLQAGDPRPRA